MDERRQGIADLLKRIEDYGRSLDAARETLGAAALSHVRAVSALAEDVAEGKRLERDLVEARARAISIQENTARLHELQLAERDKKRELESLRTDQLELRARLGEAALGSSTPPVSFAQFRDRIDVLAARIEEQEARIAELESNEEGGGLIAQIGRSARSALLRSAQTARRAEGRRILSEAGAALALTDEVHSSEDDAIRAAYDALHANAEATERGHAELADIHVSVKELRSTLALGGGVGNPRRAVARLEKIIAEGEERAARLRREVGARLLAVAEGEAGAGKRKDALADFAGEFLSDPGAADALSMARASAASTVAAKRQIEKLEASLRIDSLSSELVKLRGAVSDHERRIETSTHALEDLALRIADAEREIAALARLSEGR